MQQKRLVPKDDGPDPGTHSPRRGAAASHILYPRDFSDLITQHCPGLLVSEVMHLLMRWSSFVVEPHIATSELTSPIVQRGLLRT